VLLLLRLWHTIAGLLLHKSTPNMQLALPKHAAEIDPASLIIITSYRQTGSIDCIAAIVGMMQSNMQAGNQDNGVPKVEHTNNTFKVHAPPPRLTSFTTANMLTTLFGT